MVYSTDSFVVIYSHEASVEISFLETCSAQNQVAVRSLLLPKFYSVMAVPAHAGVTHFRRY